MSFGIIGNVARLSPFIVGAVVFLSKFPSGSDDNTVYIPFKCFPIAALAFFAISSHLKNKDSYSWRIFLSLVISLLADVFICFESTFLVAVALFASVQVNYLTSFGLKPLRMDIAFIIIIVETIACFYLIPFIDIYMLKFILPGYVTLLFAMVWRSCARINLSGKHVDWPLVFAALGSISFAASDLILCYDAFVQKFEYGTLYIMSTYYFAQFGITLSVLSSSQPKSKKN